MVIALNANLGDLMKTVKSDIKNKKLRKCYLLYGGEAYIRNSLLKRIKESAVSGDFADMNVDIFKENESVNKIIDAAETLPFMSEKRVVIVKDSGLFKAGRKDDSERMASFVSDIPEGVVLVFSEEEADKRLKLFKTVLKEGHAAECKQPEGNELYKWAETYTAKYNVKMERQVTIYFFRKIGEGIETALLELKKLINYKGGSGEITKNDIDTICSSSLEARIFDLVAAIGKRDTSYAVKLYRELLINKEQPVGILAMIARQFRLMLESGLLYSEGKSVLDMVKIMGQKDFVINQCLAQSRNFTSDILKKALKDCLETDYNIKSGLINGEMAVEALIISYSK